jgi:hypothetical protein
MGDEISRVGGRAPSTTHHAPSRHRTRPIVRAASHRCSPQPTSMAGASRGVMPAASSGASRVVRRRDRRRALGEARRAGGARIPRHRSGAPAARRGDHARALGAGGVRVGRPRNAAPTGGPCPFRDAPPPLTPLDAAHRERPGLGPARPAAQEQGWPFAQPDSDGPFPALTARCPTPRPPQRADGRREWATSARACIRHEGCPPRESDDHARATGAGGV